VASGARLELLYMPRERDRSDQRAWWVVGRAIPNHPWSYSSYCMVLEKMFLLILSRREVVDRNISLFF
jgi:hypothetical protein